MDVKVVNITEIVEINSNELNNNILENLKKNLIKIRCNKNIGQLIDIVEITNIESLPILRNLNPSFRVTFKGKIIKPEVNMKVLGKVKTLSLHGIIFDYYNFTIFVPGSYLKSRKERYLEVFGLEKNATEEEIKKKYKKLQNKNNKYEDIYEYLLNPKPNDKELYYNGREYQIGDEMDIIITTIKYSKHNFTCIGKFV
jgi:DNA-directed RNA polymerase subunit E'/Rpb7